MNFGTLIAQYGYLAVFLGTIVEGETVLLLAGFAAHRGHLELWLVAACAFAGSLLSDQIYFYIGRKHGPAWLARHPSWERRLGRVRGLTDRRQVQLSLAFRFIYGIRTISPFALGLSSISAARFAALNAVSAAVWSVSIAALGYVLGSTIERLFGDIERYELALFIGLAIGGAIWSLLRRRRARATAAA